MATPDRLTRRALNRTTLERQLLLRRSELPVLDAVEHLVGLAPVLAFARELTAEQPRTSRSVTHR